MHWEFWISHTQLPQVSDEMHVWIIIWHDEQHLSVQDMQALLDVVSSKQSITS